MLSDMVPAHGYGKGNDERCFADSGRAQQHQAVRHQQWQDNVRQALVDEGLYVEERERKFRYHMYICICLCIYSYSLIPH